MYQQKRRISNYNVVLTMYQLRCINYNVPTAMYQQPQCISKTTRSRFDLTNESEEFAQLKQDKSQYNFVILFVELVFQV